MISGQYFLQSFLSVIAMARTKRTGPRPPPGGGGDGTDPPRPPNDRSKKAVIIQAKKRKRQHRQAEHAAIAALVHDRGVRGGRSGSLQIHESGSQPQTPLRRPSRVRTSVHPTPSQRASRQEQQAEEPEEELPPPLLRRRFRARDEQEIKQAPEDPAC